MAFLPKSFEEIAPVQEKMVVIVGLLIDSWRNLNPLSTKIGTWLEAPSGRQENCHLKVFGTCPRKACPIFLAGKECAFFVSCQVCCSCIGHTVSESSPLSVKPNI